MNIENLTYDLKAPGAKKAIFIFFIRLALLFTIWIILYNRVLYPALIIDRPLTNFISIFVIKGINFLSSSSDHLTIIENTAKHINYLMKNNTKVLGIAYACNGLDLITTYIGVIILLPYPLKRKIIFSLGGIMAITIANIIRISALYFLYVYKNSYFAFNHHYLFTILMDILIFYGWLLFIKKKRPDEKSV